MDRKTIFITGAASGIGRATAERFAGQGWFVGLYDIDEPALMFLHQQLGAEHSCYRRLDVTDTTSIAAAIEQFGQATKGRMDVLFNCAGVLTTGRFEEIEPAAHHRIIDVNFKGLLNCSLAAYKLLKATPDAAVVSMSSASAGYGTPEYASYSATKFAVRGLTEALNIEWAKHDIHVCDVMPPFVDTPMLEATRGTESAEKMGVHLTPADVANIVYKAAQGNRIHWVVSWRYKLLYGLMRLLPSRLQRWAMRQVAEG